MSITVCQDMLKDAQARAERAEALLAKATDALADYACPGIRKCTAKRLDDGSCIRALSGECGDLASVVFAELRAAEEERG